MTTKLCPFTDHGESKLERFCDSEECQLWVALRKPRTYSTPEHPFMKTADPEYEYQYTGCGLVRVIPWELVKKPKEEEKQNE